MGRIKSDSAAWKSLARSIISSFQDAVADRLFLAILLLSTALRVIYVSQPIKYDEAYSFLNFINQNNPLRLVWYSSANNHILHNIITKVSVTAFGGSVLAIRLCSFVSGLLLIFLCFYLAKRINSSGYVAALCAGITPVLIGFSTNGRGYTLLLCITVICIGLCIEQESSQFSDFPLTYGLISAFGALTLPTFIIVAISVLIWGMTNGIISYQHSKRLFTPKTALLATGWFVIFVGLFYSPTLLLGFGINGLNLNQAYGAVIHQGELITGAAESLSDNIKGSFNGISLVTSIAFVSFMVIGILSSLYSEGYRVHELLLITICVSAVIIFMKGYWPPARAVLYILPISFLLADQGVSRLISICPKLLKVFLGLLTLTLTFYEARRHLNGVAISHYEYRHEAIEAENAIKVIRSITPQGKFSEVRTHCCIDAPLTYYQWLNNEPIIINGIHLDNSPTSLNSFVKDLSSDLNKFLGRTALGSTVSNEFRENVARRFYIYQNGNKGSSSIVSESTLRASRPILSLEDLNIIEVDHFRD